MKFPTTQNFKALSRTRRLVVIAQAIRQVATDNNLALGTVGVGGENTTVSAAFPYISEDEMLQRIYNTLHANIDAPENAPPEPSAR